MKISRKEAAELAALAIKMLVGMRPDMDKKCLRVIASNIYRMSKAEGK